MDGTPKSLGDGRYSLVDPLGEGGMATVWRAYDHRLGVWRAIKLLSPEFGRKRKLRARFDSEARTLALLEHPNVVRVYDVGVEDDQPYIVMELAEGGTPNGWVEQHGPMPPRMAVEVTRQLCAGIVAAHERGIVHRDVKPHNLLVTRHGTCKVTDFGIARLADPDTGGQNLTRTGSVMGTLGFMAPEQRYDAKTVDVRSDVYAIGATLYTLLTNRTNMELFAAEQEPAMLEGVPAALVPVILRATKYKREERYPDVASMDADLAAALSELPVDPPGTPPLVQSIGAAPPVPEAPPPNPTLAIDDDAAPASGASYKPAKLTPRPVQRSALPPLAGQSARPPGRIRPDVPIGAAAPSERRPTGDGPDPDYIVANPAPEPRAQGLSRAALLQGEQVTPDYVVQDAAPARPPQSYTIDLEPEEKPQSDGTLGDDEDEEEEEGQKLDTTGGEVMDILKFVWQVVWNLLQGLAYPARFVAGPLGLFAIVALIIISLGTNLVGSAASTAEQARDAYVTSFETDHAELVAIVIEAGGNDKLLNQYLREYEQAETPERKVEIAKKLQDAIAYESKKPQVADGITRNGKKGAIDVGLRRLDAARQLHDSSWAAWEEAASSTRGKWAIAAGAADAPGEE